ncbi:protein lifeguard 1-like [Contarinia nasturtii]|uniref:protein lifeguard 1-like n=1 Tax=Contarinia nasturtii TaxID=265458 RepID=UPI0012D452E9|nr:protein lifeguard 1-like [Contarinia nasturtii]
MESQDYNPSAENAQTMDHPGLVNGSSLAASNYQQNKSAQMEQPTFESSNCQSSLSPTNQNAQNSQVDPEGVKGFDFNDDTIRRKFVRKVFTLLSIQLVFTFSLVLLPCLSDGVKSFMKSNGWICWVSLIVLFGTLIAIAYNERFRRTHPTNLICLVIITVALATFLSYLTAASESDILLTAIGLTAITVLGLYIFAKQTKWDFTQYNLYGALLVFIIGLFLGIIIRKDIFHIFLCCVGATLFSVYLIRDIQLITSGEHKYKLSPDEHILATLILYIDIVHVFHNILRLLKILKKFKS